jgi:hypothetical protein
LVDLQPLTAGPGEEAIQASVTDLDAMYHYRHGLDAICVRILSCFPRPTNVRMLSTWLSLPEAQVPQA